MGLTQEALARISGLSRSTINAVETKSIGNLSITKAESLLESIGLSIGVGTPIRAGGKQAPASRTALERAAATASVSYGTSLIAKQLEEALVTGVAPEKIKPHIQALLDEAPVSLLAKLVDELHVERGLERAFVWSQMRTLAHQVQCYRPIWK